jgi:hypothetical protein
MTQSPARRHNDRRPDAVEHQKFVGLLTTAALLRYRVRNVMRGREPS